jgi:hypothetical protein
MNRMSFAPYRDVVPLLMSMTGEPRGFRQILEAGSRQAASTADSDPWTSSHTLELIGRPSPRLSNGNAVIRHFL